MVLCTRIGFNIRSGTSGVTPHEKETSEPSKKGKVMAMWLVLCSALALLLFGSKLVSLTLQGILFAIHKVGLLSNIAVNEKTKLQLTVGTVKICIWRNVWKFLRSPTQQPLITLEIASVHLLLLAREGSQHSDRHSTTKTTVENGRATTWEDIDTTMSLTRLDHPAWKSVGTWLHRLSFLCFIIPLIGISVSDIAVDVVQVTDSANTSIVRVQKASVELRFQYDFQSSDIHLSVRICEDAAATITMAPVGAEASIKDLKLRLSMPFSRSAEDLRAPIPSSIEIECSLFSGSLDLAVLLKELTQQRQQAEETSRGGVSSSPVQLSGERPTPWSNRFLAVRMMELIPNIHVKVVDCRGTLLNGAKGNAETRISALECRMSKPKRLRLGQEHQQANDNSDISEERKIVLDIGQVSVSFGPSSTATQPSSLCIDLIKVEVDGRLATIPSIDETVEFDEEAEHSQVQLLCNGRVNGECRGIHASLGDDLAPWVRTMYPTAGSSENQGDEQPAAADRQYSSWDDFVSTEVQVQVKVLRTEILCPARNKRCVVLPKGVPDIGLSVDEIVFFAHPFMGNDGAPLGIRAKADLQGSRVKLFYAQPDRLMRTPFLSLDFVRVLIEPVCGLSSTAMPAEIDMDVEWLEVRWTPEAMHSIGGLLDLGIFVMAPLMEEKYDWTSDEYWDPQIAQAIPEMKTLLHITEDHVTETETIKFRCKLKRGLVTFSHTHGGRNHLEYVTVDTLNMSVEETTGRFRLSILDVNVSSTEGTADTRTIASTTSPSTVSQPLVSQQQRVMRRRPSTLQTTTIEQRAQAGKKSHTPRATRKNHPHGSSMPTHRASHPFFSVKVFALEENKLLSCPMKVLDMFVDGVAIKWNMETQERIVELIRQITFSVWEMLYRMRSSYGIHCTSSTSRYNREGGRNIAFSDLPECLRAEKLLTKLISAGGANLERIYATNIDLQASFAKSDDKALPYEMKLHIGVFASGDLPELWLFENVHVMVGGSLELVRVDRVVVRHTVDKRRDYVFGFFEEGLRLRQRVCGRLPIGLPRNDGMIIDIEGLRIGFSLQLDLVDLASAIEAHVSPHISTHAVSFTSPWRPQHDIFFIYFLRMPKTPGQPKIWLQLTSAQFECIDDPLEAWLEHVYPVWMEELAEQELREQLLEEQVTSLKLANTEMLLSGEAAEEMKTLLREKSSKIYVQKIKKLQANLHHHHGGGATSTVLQGGTIISAHVGFISIDITFEANERRTARRIKDLDEATSVLDHVLRTLELDPTVLLPKYALALDQSLDVSVLDVSVRMRNFPTPVAIIEQIKANGTVIIAATQTPADAVKTFALTSSLRCFADMNVAIRRPTVFFGPGYIYTLLELASIAERITPTLILDVDSMYHTTPWDIARRLLHGRLHLEVDEVALRLLATSTTFECGGYLEVAVDRVAIECNRVENALASVKIDRLTAKIEPDARVNIAELSSLTLEVQPTWGTAGDASMHYIYPVEYRHGSSAPTIVDLVAGTIWRGSNGISIDVAKCLDFYRATQFAVSVSGRIAPKSPSDASFTRREIASRSAVVLYTKHVEWLIGFGRLYQGISRFAFPRRRRRQRQSKSTQGTENRFASLGSEPILTNLERFLAIVDSVAVEEFALVGLDVALYHSEKSPVGIRACINDKVTVSGSLRSKQNVQSRVNSFRQQTDRPICHLQIECNGYTFFFHDASIDVCDIQVRICTPSTGSRGESLVSIRDVNLTVGGDSSIANRPHMGLDFAAMHHSFDTANNVTAPNESASQSETTPSASTSRTSSLSFSVHQATGNSSDQSRTKSKKNILDHFAIEQHNPYRFRDDSPDEVKPTTRQDSTPAFGSGSGAVPKSHHTSGEAVRLTFINEFRRQGFALGLVASEVRVLVTLDTVESMVDITENWVQVIRACLPEAHQVPDELTRQPANSDDQATTQPLDLDSPKKATSLADDPRFGPIFHAANPLPTNRLQSFSFDAPSAGEPATQQATSLGSAVVEPFITVRFMDLQVNFQDHQHKGSVLLALSCGSLRHSRSQDTAHELIDLKVDGVQLFTAPLDVDVKSRIIWLRTLADGISYCASSYGLLKQVVAPIPAHVMIWIDRDAMAMNRVDLQIPTVQVGVNIDSKNILQNLVVALIDVLTAKLSEYPSPDYSKILQGFRGCVTSPGSATASVQQLLIAKRQLKWKIAELDWRHTCRWNYHASERNSLAMTAIEGVRIHGALDQELMHSSPMFVPRQMSSASVMSGMSTSLSLTGSNTTHVEAASDELQRLQQQHRSMGEVLRALVAAELATRQPNPKVQLVFALQSASFTLSSANFDIVSATVTKLTVKLKMFEDQSGTFALTLQDISCANLCPNTPYPELLQLQKNSKSWNGDEMFVRVDADVAPPVGGTKVVRHFEVNVHPLQVCLTYDLILQLVSFFTSVSSGATTRQEEKKAEIRSQFLSAPQQVCGGSSEGLIRKAVKVAGKAAHPLTHGLSRTRTDADQEQALDPRVKAMQALQDEASQWISKVAQFGASSGSEDDVTADNNANKEIKDCANPNILFKRIRIGTVEVMVSFKTKKNTSTAPPPLALEDMRGFDVKIHSLVYCDKTCSLLDLLLRMRRDILVDVLSQVGRNFTNVANFLRDQFDISRWAAFDALAPLKSLSTAITGASSNNSSNNSITPSTPSAVTSSSSASTNSSSLSVEMLQRGARVSKDIGATSAPTTPVDSSKVFQLELPETHLSRKKKHNSFARTPEPTTSKNDSTTTTAGAPATSPGHKDESETMTATTPAKPKKMLSSFFSKSKKAFGSTSPKSSATPPLSADQHADN